MDDEKELVVDEEIKRINDYFLNLSQNDFDEMIYDCGCGKWNLKYEVKKLFKKLNKRRS